MAATKKYYSEPFRDMMRRSLLVSIEYWGTDTMEKFIVIGMLKLVLEHFQQKDKENRALFVGQELVRTPAGEIRFVAKEFDRIIFQLFHKTDSLLDVEVTEQYRNTLTKEANYNVRIHIDGEAMEEAERNGTKNKKTATNACLQHIFEIFLRQEEEGDSEIGDEEMAGGKSSASTHPSG